jgi:hypothetical protein
MNCSYRCKTLLLMVVCTAITALLVGPFAQAATVVHRYDFENDDAADSVDAVNGNLVGTPTFSSDSMSGTRAIMLNGADQYIDYPDPMEFGSQFSIAAWVKPDPAGTNIQTIMANAPGGSKTDGFKLFFNSWSADGLTNDHKVILETGDGADAGAAAATEPDALPLDAWSQVVSAVDVAAGTVTTYVDGVKLVDNGPVVTDMVTSAPWEIGAMLTGGWLWTGGIDDVQIYSGLLSDAQAGWLHANPGSVVPEPSTVVMLLIAAAGLLAFRRRRAA